MRFLAESKELAKAIAHVVRVFGKDSSPLRLIARDNQIMLQGNGKDTWSQATITGQVLESGQVVLPGWWTSQIVGALPAGEMKVQTQDKLCQFVINGATVRVRTLDDSAASAFPDLSAKAIAVEPAAFELMVGAVGACAAVQGDDLNRPVLLAMNLTVRDGQLTAQATNRYKFGQMTIPLAGASDGSWLVPSAWLESNAKGVAGIAFGERSVRVAGSVDGVSFEDGTTVFDGEFPHIDRLVATSTGLRIQVNRVELQAALRLLRAVSVDTKAPFIRLTTGVGEVVLSLPGENMSGEQHLPALVEKLDASGAWVETGDSEVLYCNPLYAERAVQYTSDERTMWLQGGNNGMMSLFYYEDTPSRVYGFANHNGMRG